jgi:hypothetical protein
MHSEKPVRHTNLPREQELGRIRVQCCQTIRRSKAVPHVVGQVLPSMSPVKRVRGRETPSDLRGVSRFGRAHVVQIVCSSDD